MIATEISRLFVQGPEDHLSGLVLLRFEVRGSDFIEILPLSRARIEPILVDEARP